MLRKIVGLGLIAIFLYISNDCEAKYFQQYNYGLKLELPDAWECVAQSDGAFLAVFVAPEMKQLFNTLTLGHESLPVYVSLADYVQQTHARNSRELTRYQLLNRQLNDDNFHVPYYLLTYTWEPYAETKVFVMQMITCRSSEVMIITCCAPDDMADYYKDIFLKIFNHAVFIN